MSENNDKKIEIRVLVELTKGDNIIKPQYPNLISKEIETSSLEDVNKIYYMAFCQASIFLHEVLKASKELGVTIHKGLQLPRTHYAGYGSSLCNNTSCKCKQDD